MIYRALAQNMHALKLDERFSDKGDVEIADIAYYRGVMEKAGEIKGALVDYNKCDTKALLFGVSHVEAIENHEVLKQPAGAKSRDIDVGHFL